MSAYHESLRTEELQRLQKQAHREARDSGKARGRKWNGYAQKSKEWINLCAELESRGVVPEPLEEDDRAHKGGEG